LIELFLSLLNAMLYVFKLQESQMHYKHNTIIAGVAW